MEDVLITLLSSLKYPVIRQGGLAPSQAYPDTFITFWNNDDSEHSAYDNQTASAEVSFDVNVYSNSPATTYSVLTQARDLLKTNGWIILTRAYDVASDEITHTGRGFEVAFLQTQNL